MKMEGNLPMLIFIDENGIVREKKEIVTSNLGDDFNIRAAIDEELVNKCAELEHELFSDPWSEKMIAESLGYDYNHLIIYENDTDFGYLIFSLVCGEAELFRIGVTKLSQNKGIGRKLMIAFDSFLENEQAESIFLEVRKGNIAARNLYDSRQFEEIGTKKNYYKNPTEDAIFMKKELR